MVTDKDNSDGGNGEKKDSLPEVCGTCNFWKLELAMVNQQTKLGLSPCMCEGQEAAPFGVVMAGFGGCDCWTKRKQQPKIVTPPKGLNLKSRLQL